MNLENAQVRAVAGSDKRSFTGATEVKRLSVRFNMQACLKCTRTKWIKALGNWRLHSWLETTRKALRGPKRRYTVPNTLNLKQRSPGIKYEPYEVRDAAQKLKNNKYADLARGTNASAALCAGLSLSSLSFLLALYRSHSPRSIPSLSLDLSLTWN